MGEIAEGMIDGTLCSSCGGYVGESDGFPVECASCAMDSGGASLPGSGRSQKRKQRRIVASRDVEDEAAKVAYRAGLRFTIHPPNQYNLRDKHRKWCVSIYPSNQRIYRASGDAPFVKVEREWTVLDVVRAFVEELSK